MAPTAGAKPTQRRPSSEAQKTRKTGDAAMFEHSYCIPLSILILASNVSFSLSLFLHLHAPSTPASPPTLPLFHFPPFSSFLSKLICYPCPRRGPLPKPFSLRTTLSIHLNSLRYVYHDFLVSLPCGNTCPGSSATFGPMGLMAACFTILSFPSLFVCACVRGHTLCDPLYVQKYVVRSCSRYAFAMPNRFV